MKRGRKLAGGAPVVLALLALLLTWVVLMWRHDESASEPDAPVAVVKPAADDDPRTPEPPPQSTQRKKRELLPPSPASRAEDFPHNLKTFGDWGSITAEQMTTYRTSLIARVGLWEAAEVGKFFFRASEEIDDPAALREFRESVLGVWCAKDVRACLDELTERGDDAAKQDAFAGWAREDWLTALRFLQTHGDQAVEARLGGDSSRFAKHLISEVARANGLSEAAEVVGLFRSVKNQQAAQSALEAAGGDKLSQ